MEREIGEIFKYKNTKLQVLEAKNAGHICKECEFLKYPNSCIKEADIMGSCSKCLRTDRKNVIFKKVEKYKEIPLIFKGILLWITAINTILLILIIASVFGNIFTIIYLIVTLFSCYLCYKIISIDEFEKITFCKYFDINLKDE